MINFAAVQNGVVCYPDLVKVSVALDNGAIVSFDQTGMLMNHTDRALPAAKVSKSTLEKELNPMLKLQKVSLVLIPSTDGQEKLCYEFKCINDKKQNVIDYFNARTGVEEQILIVLDTPGGQLPV
jgi:germination protein YpeB